MAKIRERWESFDYAGLVALEPSLLNHVKVYEKDPSARSARAMLALVTLEKGDQARAASFARDLENGPDGSSRDAGAVVRSAIDRRAGRFDDALAVLREGLVLYPASVELHVGEGYARLAREEYAWARRSFEEALTLDAEHEDALAGMGERLAGREQEHEAQHRG
jgi:Flp pilus assembly protein TadD